MTGSELVTLDFHGDDLFLVDVDGQPHVVLKPAIESLGLDYWAQIERLRRHSWAALGKRRVQLPRQAQRR